MNDPSRKKSRSLKLGDGEVFHGEGILAVTKALLQSGVAYVGGYQGAPVSHMMDVLNDARDILDELGIHVERQRFGGGRRGDARASINYPMRGAVTFKSTVGTKRRLRRALQPGFGRRAGRHADRAGRGLRRGLLDHPGAQPASR